MKSSPTAQDLKEEIFKEEPGLVERLQDYAKTNIKLYKYKAIDKGSGIAATVVSMVLMVILFLIGFVILSIGLALLIGYWLGAGYYGFFIIGIVYFLLGVLIYAFRNKFIRSPLISSLTKKVSD